MKFNKDQKIRLLVSFSEACPQGAEGVIHRDSSQVNFVTLAVNGRLLWAKPSEFMLVDTVGAIDA